MSFYLILSLISGLCVLFLGLFVLGKNRKTKANQIFFLFTLSVSIWLLATFKIFLSKTAEEAIFWDRIVYSGVVFIPTFFYHFVLLFAKIKNQKKLLYLGYFLSFLFLILSQTNYFVASLYKYPWGVHTQAKIFHHFFLIFFASYILLAFFNIYRYHQQTKGIERMQSAYILLVLFIMILNLLAFLPAYGINYPSLFSYILPVIAVLILTLAIVRYHLFEIRVILTELLVGVMGAILFLLPFLMPTVSLMILTTGIFLFFCLSGYLLIRATHQEIRRRAEIEKLYEELKVLDRAKSEFISMASHQLRTPLSAIKGYISMLIEGSYGQPPEKMKEKLQNVYYSNERLIKIVNDLLNISKIELGKMELEKEPCQIEDLIDTCFQEMEIEVKKKNLKFIFNKPKISLPKINLDKSKIHQVILNLIDNAIRYTQSGYVSITANSKSEIPIRPSPRAMGPIRPSLRAIGRNSKQKVIIIEVKDTGGGLTKEEKKKIFESFTRGAAGIAYWIEGAGLGLYVAKKYVELHNGKIWAESQGKGKGSTFFIELPIKR